MSERDFGLRLVGNQMKWFINECGEVYEYDSSKQRADFPNDFPTPYDSQREAMAAAAALNDAQDWRDDADRFAGQGAFITLTATDGEYTDFNLTAEQVAAVFATLATGVVNAL